MKSKLSDSKSPININAVVDPSAALTDPADENFAPQSQQELEASIKKLVQGTKLSPEEAFAAVKKSFLKSEEEMSKAHESIIRKQVKSVLQSLMEARPKGSKSSPTGIKWGQRVPADYKPGHPGWEKAVAELRAMFGKMQDDDSSAEEKKNFMGVFTIDDVRKVFEAEGLEAPSVGGVKKIELDAMERAKNVEPALQKAESDPDAFMDFAASIGAPFTSMMPNEVEPSFYSLALERTKISDDEKDAIQDTMTSDEPSEEASAFHIERLKKIASSPVFEEVLEKRLEDVAELAIENLVRHNQWDILDDEDARHEYIGNQIKMARGIFLEKLSKYLVSAHTKEASGVSEASWKKFSKSLTDVAKEFMEFYES